MTGLGRFLLHPEVGRAVEQEMARAMIDCLADPDTAEAHLPSPHRPSVMARLEQVFEAQADEPFYVTDVCASIGVSERTLRQHC